MSFLIIGQQEAVEGEIARLITSRTHLTHVCSFHCTDSSRIQKAFFFSSRCVRAPEVKVACPDHRKAAGAAIGGKRKKMNTQHCLE